MTPGSASGNLDPAGYAADSHCVIATTTDEAPDSSISEDVVSRRILWDGVSGFGALLAGGGLGAVFLTLLPQFAVGAIFWIAAGVVGGILGAYILIWGRKPASRWRYDRRVPASMDLAVGTLGAVMAAVYGFDLFGAGLPVMIPFCLTVAGRCFYSAWEVLTGRHQFYGSWWYYQSD